MTDETSLSGLIQKRRLELGLSLREVARRTNLTASFLSQIENKKANPSLDSLRRLSEVLGVSILDLLPQQESNLDKPPDGEQSAGLETQRLVYSPVVRSDARARLILPSHGVAYQLLSPDLSRKMEAIMGTLYPGSGNVARRLREPTEEFIYVLSGELLVQLEEEVYVLKADDSIYFDGLSLHRLECASENEPVRWISVFTPAVF